MSFSPREISINATLQKDIALGLNEAHRLEAISKERELSNEELVNLTLCYLEASDWENTALYAGQVLKREISGHPLLPIEIDLSVEQANRLEEIRNNLTLEPGELMHLILCYIEASDWKNVCRYAGRALRFTPTATNNNEDGATALYALEKACSQSIHSALEIDVALLEHAFIFELAKSPWLKGSILIAMGQLYLKHHTLNNGYLKLAISPFERYLRLCEGETTLAGFLPKVFSYIAHCQTSIAFLKKELPLEGLVSFQKASDGYKALLTQKNIDRQESCDYKLYCKYRDMALEKIYAAAEIDLILLGMIDPLLTEALADQKANKADNVCIGNTCFRLGNIHEHVGNHQKAYLFYSEAITHYKKSDAKEKINIVKSRLGKICFLLGQYHEKENHKETANKLYYWSIKYYQKKSSKIKEILSLGDTFGETCCRLGKTHQNANKHEEARICYKAGLTYYTHRSDQQSIDQINGYLREISFSSGAENLIQLSITPPVSSSVNSATNPNNTPTPETSL